MSGETPSSNNYGAGLILPGSINTVRGGGGSIPSPWSDDRQPHHSHSRSSTHSNVSNLRGDFPQHHHPHPSGFTPSSSTSFFHFSPNPNGNPQSSTVPNIQQFPDEIQEKFIVQELIHVLGGLESHLITCYNVKPNRVAFSVDQRILPSISTFATEVAVLASHYHTVTRFVEKIHKFEHGRVNHALVSAIEELLKEYYILLTQLNVECRKGDLNLRNLWFFISPSLSKMSIVSSIVSEIEEKQLTGAAVLTLLHEKAISLNNSSDENLCYVLAEKVSIPYFETLEQWIYKGVIKDKFSEFFVLDSDKSGEEAQLTDNYWEKRYTPLPEKCPSFLLKNLMQVLKAGKYLNVIRHCGKDIETFRGEKIIYSIHERDYVDKIEKAYSYASKKLLSLLLDEYDLMKRLQSVKHYLLMDKGDFIVQFMDLTDAELSKPIDDLNPSRLESLMGLALRTSSAVNDPYKDCLKVQLFPYGIGEQLMTIIAIETPMERSNFQQACNYKIPGAEGFSFSIEVKWPISLVLTARVIVCYQLVFRHLFFCKHVERQLCNVWIHGKGSSGKTLYSKKEQAAVFSLRQKMLNFVQNFQYYMAFEVIEPAWNSFLSTMQKVSNVDEVLSCHLEMVTSILDDSMLTSQVLLEKINKILSLCLRFCKKIAIIFELTTPEANIYEKVISADSKFCKLLVNFLQEVSSIAQSSNKSNKVGNIIHRMNFNGFYTTSLENNESSLRNLSLSPTISSGLKITSKVS